MSISTPPTNRRDFLKQSLLAGSTLALGACRGPGKKGYSPGKSPNLLFVFPDQMRGMAMGFLGEEAVHTPQLDKFAKESLVLPQTISNYPICSPYRASLMTGKYPLGNGVLENCNSRSGPYGVELRTNARCWSDVLKDKGYSLGYIGKWHLDTPHKPYVDTSNNRGKCAWNEWTPPARRHGFDFWHAYGTYDVHNRPEYWATNASRDQRTVAPKWGPEYETDLAIEYLKNTGGQYRKQDKPFALVVSMNPPHMPYHMVPGRYVKKYQGKTWQDLVKRGNIDLKKGSRFGKLAKQQTKNYFAQITGVDDQFGRLLTCLEATGLADNTIVVFTSDHGNCLGCHNQVSKNNQYEESLRVPFLIRWPGRIKARQDDLLLSTPDIYPTLLDLMGFADACPAGVEGTSHAGIFRGNQGQRPTSQLYLKCTPGKPGWGRRGVRTHRHTLTIFREPGKPEKLVLYDNQSDPYQLNNIAPSQPKMVQRLIHEELIPWLQKTDDPWQKTL